MRGVRAHRKAGEQTCDLCKSANAEYLRVYRIRKAVEANPEAALRDAEQRVIDAELHLETVKDVIGTNTPTPASPVVSTDTVDDIFAVPDFLG